MTTRVDRENQGQIQSTTQGRIDTGVVRLLGRTIVREVLYLMAFCGFTSVLTWPYVARLRDVVIDKGDPYLITWILWWDYHQTFTDPLHLFDSNTFYPLKYTLAFSENSYGISMLFFPLYALGFAPLTVHAVAMFFAFALNGYAAFRLGRTLTGSTAVGWIAGIIYAFVPYRYNMMSQVAYLFSPWVPLVFEALILFTRERSKKRALWLGIAFFMNGLTTITWFTFTIIPFVLYAAILLTRYRIWRDRAFWVRAATSLSIASLALLPFMIPYAIASRLYNFKREIDEVKANSAMPWHWLSVENRNKFWRRMGEGVTEGYKFKLFPGLLPIMFSLAALGLNGKTTSEQAEASPSQGNRSIWIPRLDALIVVLFALSLLAIGFDRTSAFHGFFDTLTSERALSLLTISILLRLSIAYPAFLHGARRNLVETLRSNHRSDAFWLGIILTILGFCFSLGWNFFFYRICYQLLPMFKSMRVVTRGAVLTYLGLALLSGIGVQQLVPLIRRRFPAVSSAAVFVGACVLLLVELNAAPLKIERGDPYPDGVTLRLKQTPMRGGIVLLPAGGDNNYRYMLRAADHQKPLVVSTSGFNSYNENHIEELISKGAILDELMTFMEGVPTSYLVVANPAIPADRLPDYQAFLSRAMLAGRLRFINRYDGRDDLYAVVKNEPQAASEGLLPFDPSFHDWAQRIHEEPTALLGQPLKLSQRLFRLHVATFGQMPRYEQFRKDIEAICRGVIVGSEDQEQQLSNNFQIFINEWVKREAFATALGKLDDLQYVNQLVKQSEINMSILERQKLVDGLTSQQDSRAGVLLKIVDNALFEQGEKNPSLVALHYFGYLRRNPDDPPDKDLSGFNFWLNDIEHNSDPRKLPTAFSETDEYKKLVNKTQ